MKGFILKLMVSIVVDVLIQLVSKKLADANDPMNKEKWQIIVDFLNEVKKVGLP